MMDAPFAQKLKKTASAVARVCSWAVLVAAFGLSLYQVWRTMGSAPTSRKVTLDFLWPTYTPQKVRYGEYLARRYMELHPDVHVNLILTPDPYRKLQVMVAGRTTPDVIWMGIGWQEFCDALTPMAELVAKDPDVKPEDYFPGLWQAVHWQGELYGLPSSGQTGVIYYNKDLFDQEGLEYPSDDWTWDDLLRMARALTKDFDGDGMIDQYGIQLGQIYLVPFMVYDGQFADAEWRMSRLDNPVTRALLDRYQALMYEHRVMPTPMASEELGMLPMFEAGRVAMHAASGYAIESFRKAPFDWDVAPLPAFDYEGRRYHATGLWQEEFCMVWDTDIPDLAWDFVKFCTGREMVRWAALEGHIVPGRVDVALSKDYLNQGRRPANMGVFTDSMAFAVPIMPHPWWRRMSVDFNPITSRFLVGVEGKRATVDETVTELHQALQKVLDDYHDEAAVQTE